MKRILLLLTILLSLTSYSQTKIKFGLNSPMFSGSIKTIALHYQNEVDYKDISTSKGFYVGISYDMHMNEKVIFAPGISYNQLGGIDANDNDEIQKIKYLSPEFMVKYKITPDFHIGAGLQLNFATDRKSFYELKGFENNSNRNNEYFLAEVYPAINAEVNYNITEVIGVNLRYHTGIANAGNSGTVYIGNNNISVDNKINIQAVQLGLYFNIVKKKSTQDNNIILTDEIKKLNELKESGILTEEEYQKAKQKLLD